MAAYVKLLRSIWRDPDFVALPASAQRMYLLIISQPDISAAGVISCAPSRWATFAPDTTLSQVRADLKRLEAKRFVVTDSTTEELLVRTYAVHDEAWKVPNSRKALANAVDATYSAHLRSVVASQLATVGATLDVTQGLRVSPTLTVGEEATQEPPHQPSTITTTHKRAPAKSGATVARIPNPVWDALADAFGTPTTASERSNRGRQVKELTEAGATADDVHARVREHAKRRLNWTLTPNALVTHWTELDPAKNKRSEGRWDPDTQAWLAPGL